MTPLPKPPPADLPAAQRRRAYFARGRRCAAGLPEGFIAALRDCWRDAAGSPSRFAELVAERGVWEVPLDVVDGALEVRYPRCFRHNLPPVPDEHYCECSRGWLTELLARISGIEHRVELLCSVLRGDDCCRLRARGVL